MAELVVRLVFSLAVILGMLMLLTRFTAKRFRGGSDALVKVVHRQPLSRTSAVSVVTIGSRVLVLGTTEHQVQLITELDPDEVEVPAPAEPAIPSLELVAPMYVPRHAAPAAAPYDPVTEATGAAGAVASATRAARAAGMARVADGALAGSVLSAQTWKQAFAAATSRARDAS
jgi:flagellar protein FliO/FliZ